jgi:hypothetical protein
MIAYIYLRNSEGYARSSLGRLFHVEQFGRTRMTTDVPTLITPATTDRKKCNPNFGGTVIFL